MILTLHDYWSARGCAILQPYDMRVGAGTFHPATTLRSLGPEPWNVAYVQPSRRPTDGRYGENPNRLQHYYQYQVILKPSPADLQEQYLGSLAAIGIDPAQLARMHCPIGVEGIVDKAPEVIAIAVAAQLLQAVDADAAAHASPTF